VATSERHRWQFEFEHRTEPVSSYMICSMQRSGSSLLAHLMADTTLAGVPNEYLRQDLIAELKRRWGVDTFDEYLRELACRKTSPNGVFGLKAQWNQFALAIDGDPSELFPSLSFIHLRREDRVRQAVSWVKAIQTGQWLSIGGHDLRRPEFDGERIAKIVRRIEEGEAAWEAVFERHGIEPLRLTYEELAAAPAEKTTEVLEFIGVDLPAGFEIDAPLLERQADELSEEWVARYLEEPGSSGPNSRP
jgi:trehalose 2-sulfotransferase